MQRGDDYICLGRENCEERLDKSGLLERQKRSTLLHRLESFCRYTDSDLLAEFRNEKGLGLEIYLAAALARRVEFGRTDAVGVPTADLGFLSCYVACACHVAGY